MPGCHPSGCRFCPKAVLLMYLFCNNSPKIKCKVWIIVTQNICSSDMVTAKTWSCIYYGEWVFYICVTNAIIQHASIYIKTRGQSPRASRNKHAHWNLTLQGADNTRTHADAEIKLCNTSTRTELSAVASLGTLSCTSYQYFTKCLHWCVHTCTFSNFIISLVRISLHPHCRSVVPHASKVSTHTYCPTRHHCSVRAAIQSATQKCHWWLPQTVAERRML